MFVCYQRCAGYQAPGEYPPDMRTNYSLLSPFGPDGARAYQHITFVEPDDDHAAAVRAVMSQPGVASLAWPGCTSAARWRNASRSGSGPPSGSWRAAPALARGPLVRRERRRSARCG